MINKIGFEGPAKIVFQTSEAIRANFDGTIDRRIPPSNDSRCDTIYRNVKDNLHYFNSLHRAAHFLNDLLGAIGEGVGGDEGEEYSKTCWLRRS